MTNEQSHGGGDGRSGGVRQHDGSDSDGESSRQERCQPFYMIPLEPWNLEPRILSV